MADEKCQEVNRTSLKEDLNEWLCAAHDKAHAKRQEIIKERVALASSASGRFVADEELGIEVVSKESK